VPILFQIDISPFSRYGPTAASTQIAVPSQTTFRIGGPGSSTTRLALRNGHDFQTATLLKGDAGQRGGHEAAAGHPLGVPARNVTGRCGR
jgi:hypothetical protein